MGKLDALRREAAGNVDESMGAVPSAYTPRITPAPRTVPARLIGIARTNNTAEIPIEKIAPDPAQPREQFDPDELGRLADTLREHGQLQAIAVRWDEGSQVYRIIAGERRWRAGQIASLRTLRCDIYDRPLMPGEVLALQLVENTSRSDLSPLELAKGIKALMELNGLSGNQVAKSLGIAQPTVVRALSLLELPSPVQTAVEQGALSPASAYEISKADPTEQIELAARAVSEGLTRNEVREASKTSTKGKSAGKGRGGSRTKLATSRVFKAGGYRLTAENRRGIDRDGLRAAIVEILAQLDAETADDRDAA